ncbi:MAG: hypothetical protein HDS28_04190 [Bacteroides sp.]|nr:hypothetical protein [Bacteroides sp.]
MNKEFNYQKEGLASDLVELLVQDYNLDLNTALTTLYESETFAKLSDPETGLYFQGSLYVYSYLKNELQTGSIG